MWGYEGIHESRPRNNGTGTVPTAAMKNGDFSQLLALDSKYQIYNPFTRRAAATAGRYEQDKFPGNIIPANLINPVARKILEFFPDPSPARRPGRPEQLRPIEPARACQVLHAERPYRPRDQRQAQDVRPRQRVPEGQHLQ